MRGSGLELLRRLRLELLSLARVCEVLTEALKRLPMVDELTRHAVLCRDA